jgi:membrane protein
MTPQPSTELDWEGQTMLDRAGKKIGTIQEIYLVEETGRPEWALVSLGRRKRRMTLVPLAGARPGENGIRAAYDKPVVDDAPRLDADGEPSLQQVTEFYRHYRIDDGDDGDDQQDTAEAPYDTRASASQQNRTHDRAGGESRSTSSRAAANRSGGSTLKRTVKEFSDDNLPHWAAALTYYGVLSIFPALLAIVSILGLIGSSAIQPMIDNLSSVAPGPAKEILTGALQGLQQGGGAGLLFIVALAGAIWSASGYISAFMDASNAIYDIDEGRPIWKKLPLRIAITVLMLVLLAVSALAVVLTGPIADQAGKVLGVGSSALTIWNIAKWPVLVLIVSFMFAVLYYSAPNVKQPGLKAVLPGGILAVVVWIVASAAFAFYVANFGSYNKTYGALGGVIIFLVWLWISNIAVLLGAEFNAEIERGRQIEAGHPEEKEPFLEPRDPAHS